ncbi:IS1634 family transposase [Anabaena minutissima FACHB-250]|nr:IS1634 family transposase [Anabaena minutissima FACHB-250]
MVADSALYSENNLKLMENIKWISRVPLSVKSAQLLVTSLAESEFIKSELSGYVLCFKNMNYAGVQQRWLVVQSQARKKSDLEKLTKKITSSALKNQSELRKLSQEKFACEADAIKALSKLSNLFKYHRIEQSEVIEVAASSPDEKPNKTYKILVTCTTDDSKINREILCAGRFVIATHFLHQPYSYVQAK